MFVIDIDENVKFGLKPMNVSRSAMQICLHLLISKQCPGHCLMFGHRVSSELFAGTHNVARVLTKANIGTITSRAAVASCRLWCSTQVIYNSQYLLM
jgi:hypothetical protein